MALLIGILQWGLILWFVALAGVIAWRVLSTQVLGDLVSGVRDGALDPGRIASAALLAITAGTFLLEASRSSGRMPGVPAELLALLAGGNALVLSQKQTSNARARGELGRGDNDDTDAKSP